MNKKLTAICCAALLAPALYAQGNNNAQGLILRPEYRVLSQQAERGDRKSVV